MTDRERRHKEISLGLIEFNEIFETYCSNGEAFFSEKIKTACITFNKEGKNLNLVWNPNFFDSCSDYKARFILCHEMLHIFLNHGVRGIGLKEHRKANICMDISINHILIDNFGFTRAAIEGWEDLCWRDTVFNVPIPSKPSFEGYYEIDNSFFNEGFNSIDSHNFLDIPTEEVKRMSKNIPEIFPFSGEESDFIEKEIFEIESNRKKLSFGRLVEGLAASFVKKTQRVQDSWHKTPRRMALLDMETPGIIKNRETKDKKKYTCAFFVDNSGSCSGFAQKLLKVSTLLDEKTFNVELYSFDTRVFPIQKKGDEYTIVGGGGTCFECIGRKVEETNPDVVFVLTDGFASPFMPKKRKKYFWFIIDGGSTAALREAGKICRLDHYE